MTMRDLDTHPYTPDEQRVANWIVERTGGAAGAGDDPIGFLMASYDLLRAQHDARVTELLQANNREVERRRTMERLADDQRAMIDSFIRNPAQMTSPIGPLPVNSTGLRRAVDEITRLRSVLDAAHELIEAAGCTPDNGHRYWALRDAALGGEHG